MTSIKKFIFVALATVLVPVYATPSRYVRQSSNPIVKLDNDLTIQGSISSSTPNVAQFLGIPYANSPVDDLRFAPPEAYTPVNRSVLNGTALPPSCMQYTTSLPSFAVWIPHFQTGSAGLSEDCLTVSVWTPSTATGNGSLPVLIWIYGGAFVTGGVDVEWQDPAQWVQRTQEHVVVALNYRLNIFGFPNSAALDQQNVGLLDQRLAVQWVQENIAKFGGDPSRMVLWGQSAGSMSVDLYNFAWANDPIVKGLIMHSGTAHSVAALINEDTTHSNFSFVAANVGCANQTSAEAELACMRKVPASTIEDFLHSYGDAGTTPVIRFVPIADESLVFENYTQKTLNGEMSNLPAIIGFDANEGVFLAPFSFTGVNQTIADSLSDEVFWCPTVKTTFERLASNRTTHRYFYTGNFTNIAIRPWLGAYHGSELPLVFGTHSNFNSNSTPFEDSVSKTMQDSWLAFASDPINGLSSADWPPYESAKGQVLTIAANGEVTQLQTVEAIEDQCTSLGLA